MADSFSVFPSDKETGYLTDFFSSRDDFLSVEDHLSNPLDEYNVCYDGTVQPTYDDFDRRFYRPSGNKDVKLESTDVLDEVTVASGLSNLGWSADGTKQAFLHLTLSEYGLHDISLLRTFVHLQKVHIPHNEIEDLSALGNMPYLLDLDASHNCIKVVLGFTPPHNLKNVDLSFNEIKEIPDLSAHSYLQHLILNNNQILEIKGLERCSYLAQLSLSHNRISVINGLDNLPIKDLNLSFNEILKIDNIRSLPFLQKLNLAGNKIRSLKGLPNVGFIEAIQLQNNEIIDLAELENLTLNDQLRNLNLQANPIVETPDYRLAAIFAIPQLTQLDLESVTVEEKVSAKNLFDLSPEYVGSRDHMMHVVYSFLQPARMLDISLPLSDASYPMVVLIGPNGIGKKSLAQKLVEEFPDYFGYAALHTTRAPFPGETQALDYYFVAKEEFEDFIKMGMFLMTYAYQGDLYGLSLEAVEAVAAESLACIVEMELEGVLTLKNSHLQPRYVLILPENDDEFEKRIFEKGIYSEPQIKATVARVETYQSYNRLHPGFFDVTISSDDIIETYSRLRALVMHYLGFVGSSVDDSDTGVSLTDSLLDRNSRLTTTLSVASSKGCSAPMPRRLWSRPSLHGSGRMKSTRTKAVSSAPGFSAKGSVEEESLRRRQSAARDALSGNVQCQFQPQMRASSLGASALVCLDDSSKEQRHFSAPVTQINLEVTLPDSPDSSNPVCIAESTLTTISPSEANDSDSAPGTEVKQLLEYRNPSTDSRPTVETKRTWNFNDFTQAPSVVLYSPEEYLLPEQRASNLAAPEEFPASCSVSVQKSKSISGQMISVKSDSIDHGHFAPLPHLVDLL